jgi:hypothetical protein
MIKIKAAIAIIILILLLVFFGDYLRLNGEQSLGSRSSQIYVIYTGLFAAMLTFGITLPIFEILDSKKIKYSDKVKPCISIIIFILVLFFIIKLTLPKERLEKFELFFEKITD